MPSAHRGRPALIGPLDGGSAASSLEGFVPIKNRPPDQSTAPAAHLISPDALALVRFGLRAAIDPRIQNTVIDALLRVETQNGPGWHRYNGDGYGEHEDGSPFDGTGIGRLWPLLTGERGRYEWRQDARKPPRSYCEPWRSSPARAVCCRNRCGMPPTSRSGTAFGKTDRIGNAPRLGSRGKYVKPRRSLADGCATSPSC